MPLKALHILFIAAAFLLALGLAVWAFDRYLKTGDAFFAMYAIGSVVSGVVLFGYVIYFWKKMKGIR
jgi:hypothetical protein